MRLLVKLINFSKLTFDHQFFFLGGHYKPMQTSLRDHTTLLIRLLAFTTEIGLGCLRTERSPVKKTK